jgi:hypothetical protein
MDVSDSSSFLNFLFVLALLLPCGGCVGLKSTAGGTPPPKSLNVTIQLNQSAVTLQAGGQQKFTASVQGTTNFAVNWSVDKIANGSTSVGSIDAAGMYTAPAQAGTHAVTAASVADTSKTASATVTVTASSISISPPTAVMIAGAIQQFTATVAGHANLTITWSVDNVNGGNSRVGTISDAGLYTAPSTSGNHTIGATHSGTSPESGSLEVSVFTMSLSPSSADLLPAGTQQFTANLQGISNTDVIWGVDGISGGNSTVGTIDANGLYRAPNATGGHVIAVTSAADLSGSVQANITVLNKAAGAVLTYHNDDARDGAFTEETALTPSVVNSSQFGKLRSYPVDGQIYAQPLFVPQVSINGTDHAVVFVATENDTVYAFDADQQSSLLWRVSLGAPIPRDDVEGISPLLGITSTPVIDITTSTMYVVTIASGGPFFLHALDLTSGAEKFGGPVGVHGSVLGMGWDNNNGTISLEHECYQRNALALNAWLCAANRHFALSSDPVCS